MNERTIWKNGQILPEKEAFYSIYDSSLMFGDTCFEMMRTFNKQTFNLWEHIERLFKSLRSLEIQIPYTFDDLFNAHENLIIHNRYSFKKDDEIRTLINVSRGILPIYQELLEDKGEANIIIACFPLRYITKGMSRFYRTGVSAIVPSQRAIPEHLLDAKIKSRSRQHYKVANLEIARQDKDAWPLLLDPDGFVAESTGSNFFIVKNNFKLLTPKPINCLKGVSRDHVICLARKMGMKVIETDITLYDVYNAREAFFTCTPYSIMPCTRINGMPIGEGKVGGKTIQITEKWFESVKCDFISQMEAWDADCRT
jgi:branched-chain amino acid aminotransferase